MWQKGGQVTSRHSFLPPTHPEDEDRHSHMLSGLFFSQGAQSCSSPKEGFRNFQPWQNHDSSFHDLNSSLLTKALAFLRALDKNKGGPTSAGPYQRSRLPGLTAAPSMSHWGPHCLGGCLRASPSFLVTPGGPGPFVFCCPEKAEWRPRPPSRRDPHTRRKRGEVSSCPPARPPCIPAGVSGVCGGSLSA